MWRSLGNIGIVPANPAPEETRFSCVINAPFGLPVVPLYMMQAIEKGKYKNSI
jgi:hypothetical protein